MNRSETKHPSAFCLMAFRTADRAFEETVWNSRDMAVPSTISIGTHTLNHIDAHRDDFKPFYVPRVGMRIWIDPVLDRAETAAEAYFADHQHDDGFDKEFGATPKEALAALVTRELKKSSEAGVTGGPMLVQVTDHIAARIAARLSKRGAR